MIIILYNHRSDSGHLVNSGSGPSCQQGSTPVFPQHSCELIIIQLNQLALKQLQQQEQQQQQEKLLHP